MSEDDARRAAERAARLSYGRLLALLAARSRDIAAAEDALADAFLAALRTWPGRGVPANPDAWLLTAARNAAANARRRQAVRSAAEPEIRRRIDEVLDLVSIGGTDAAFADERLKLLFVCAHPAIDAGARSALMLQTVLGLDAARVSDAFLVAPAAMSQRLVRAKARIRDTGLRFEVPDRADLPGRLDDVLATIYAAYGTGWEALSGEEGVRDDLAEEAIALGRLVASLMPEEPEALGLLSLMLHCEARRPARRDGAGRFVPLARQDTRLWSRTLLAEADGLLVAAARFGLFGRFQCEAAIQSVHAQRAITGVVDHGALLALYELLWSRTGSLGAGVARAAVLLDAGRAADALAVLDALPADRIAAYQPHWVVRARASADLNRPDVSRAALDRALSLTRDPAVRRFLADEVPASRTATRGSGFPSRESGE